MDDPALPRPRRHLKTLSLSDASGSRSLPSSPRGEGPSLAKNRKRLSLQSEPPSSASPTRSSHVYAFPPEYSSPKRHYIRSPVKTTAPCAADSPSPLSASLSSSDDSRASPTPESGGWKGTLLEQHGDLLSVLAKKERRCLELREELKRNEDELRLLKSKWSALVAKDASASQRPTSPTFDLRQGAGSVEPAGDSLYPTGDDALDGPLSDVASAKRWMGGWVKSGLGILESMAAPPALPDLGLGTVREEAEEDEDATSQSESDSRRTSSTSATSLDGDDGKVSLMDADLPSLSTSPPVSPAQSMDRKGDVRHSRRRSAFEWGSWGKRLSDLQHSDSLKSSKRAMLNLVDTFERTLEQAMVPPPIDMTAQPSSLAAAAPANYTSMAQSPSADHPPRQSSTTPTPTDKEPAAAPGTPPSSFDFGHGAEADPLRVSRSPAVLQPARPFHVKRSSMSKPSPTANPA